MRIATRLRRFEPLFRPLRPFYRLGRTMYLKARHPDGVFLASNGVSVFCDVQNPTYVWYDAESPHMAFEVRVVRYLVRRSEGNVFMDVGAHFGYFAAVMADEAIASGRTPKMIAIEPDAQNFGCLARTMSQFRDAESSLLQVAAAEADGMITLYRADGPCLHSFAEPGARRVAEVQSARLDTIVEERLTRDDRVALVKIDVDGAEEGLLKGASTMLGRHRPIVMIEFGPEGLRAGGSDPKQLLAEFRSHGHLYEIQPGPGVLRPIETGDFDTLITATGDHVTDLVISPDPLAPTAEGPVTPA